MYNDNENIITEASDLFGRYRILKGDKAINERAGLIKFFTEKTGKEAKVIGIRLAHYKIDELYALQSGYNDRVRTGNKETADKWFWFTTRTKVVKNSLSTVSEK
jgi:hypothetical protein